MTNEQLRQILKSNYSRQNWLKVLQFLAAGKVDKLKDTLSPQSLIDQLNNTEKESIVALHRIGTFITSDGELMPIFEAQLDDSKKIERNRVQVNNIIKKIIQTDAIKAALCIFYNETFDIPEWRFSFVSKYSASDFFAEVEAKETNPKRYTYIFGTSDEHRTAIQRFGLLRQSNFSVEDFFAAFEVEAMSKEFFNNYRDIHYARFVEYLTGKRMEKKRGKYVEVDSDIYPPHPFLASTFNGNEKVARDFIKKMMGRIVFLYFVQKKRWMGASDSSYQDGDTNFLQNLFVQSGADDGFYPNWLVPLFFETLNVRRENDDFKMPDRGTTKIPYLNGGLFELESKKHRLLSFPAEFFKELFEFFNQYNFTIYENSPDDHTVAVDPEMLGHIFENLLEDNKDKGAFYTPKEIVHYMCQESLIEYLTTHLSDEYTMYRELGNQQIELFGNESKTEQLSMIEKLGKQALNRADVEYIVKEKDISNLTREQIFRIYELLNKVKICDPAIGSGAFPMGLLQEIFGIQEVIAHHLGTTWNPAEVKEVIIQNSIYGVDIEKGAVDIARLRFWLSLVVDEEAPKPLPNLDFKIVVGDSLIPTFQGEVMEIDWNVRKVGTGKHLAANIRTKLLPQLVTLQQQYFEAEHLEKENLKLQIRNLKLDILENQIKLNQKISDHNDPNRQIKLFEKVKKKKSQVGPQNFGKLLQKINRLRKYQEISLDHFDWKLNFSEILNETIAKDKFGFDIVIGNPPYLRVQGIRDKYPNKVNHYLKNFKSSTGRFDLYVLFSEKGFSLLKSTGFLNYIQPDKWINSDFGIGLREELGKNVYKLISFGQYQVFNVSTYTSLVWIKKQRMESLLYLQLKKPLENKDQLGRFLNTQTFDDFSPQPIDRLGKEPWILLSKENTRVFEKILKMPFKLKDVFSNISQGIVSIGDDIFIMKGVIDKGCFKGYSERLKNFVELEEGIVQQILRGDDVKKYDKLSPTYYVIYPHFELNGKTLPYEEKEFKNKYPKTYEYFLLFKQELIEKKKRYKTNPKYWYTLHRSRELKIFKTEKIVTPEISIGGNMTLDKVGFIHNTQVYLLKKKENSFSGIKAYLGILNSKLFWYYLKSTGAILRGGYFRFKTKYLEPFPIPNLSLVKTIGIEIIVSYILFINSHLQDNIISSSTPNRLISEVLEEVVDGIVFQFYFPEDFQKTHIEIIKYVERDFPSIEGIKNEEEKKKIIWEAYQKLQEKDNEIRNNLKLMKIELRDLLMPILTA